MKKLGKSICLALVAILGLSQSPFVETPLEIISEDAVDPAINALGDRVEAILYKKHGLKHRFTFIPQGAEHKVICLDFECYTPMNKAEARELVVDCQKEFLRLLKADPDAPRYLEVPSIEPYMAAVSITFSDGYQCMLHPYVKSVILALDCVRFTWSERPQPLESRKEEVESLEEALAIVHGEKMEVTSEIA